MPILTGQARLAGIVGWPVAHSRSPLVHGFWLERHRIDGAYVPLPVPPCSLAVGVRGLVAVGFRGCNVTTPHKEAAFALCDTLADAARRVRSVNTLLFRDGKIHGSSSDGAGFLANLRDHGVAPSAGPVLLIGAGGAARDIAGALLDVGAKVAVTNRSPEPAAALVRLFPALSLVAWEDRASALADHALAVNATSAGMVGRQPLVLDLSHAPASLVVADIVYAPLVTPLIAAARARGLKTVDGLGMLLHQAVAGFAAWFEIVPTVDRELTDFVARDLAAGER
jgi:shikimate dehydrogenase